MTNALFPDYDPPNQKRLSGQLLVEINKSVDLLIEEELNTTTTTLMLDGWSNISSDPIIAVSIHTGKSICLLDAISYGSEKKTAEFCSEVAKILLMKLKKSIIKMFVLFAVTMETK